MQCPWPICSLLVWDRRALEIEGWQHLALKDLFKRDPSFYGSFDEPLVFITSIAPESWLLDRVELHRNGNDYPIFFHDGILVETFVSYNIVIDEFVKIT